MTLRTASAGFPATSSSSITTVVPLTTSVQPGPFMVPVYANTVLLSSSLTTVSTNPTGSTLPVAVTISTLVSSTFLYGIGKDGTPATFVAPNQESLSPTQGGNLEPEATGQGSPSSTGNTPSPSASGSKPPPPKGKTNVGAIAGGIVGGLVVLALLFIAFIIYYKRKQRQRHAHNDAYAIEAKGHSTAGTQHSGSNEYESQHVVGGAKAYDPASSEPAQSQQAGLDAHSLHQTQQTPYGATQDTYPATEPKSVVGQQSSAEPKSALAQHVESSRGRERRVNDDGVSLRSASPDLNDINERPSFESPTESSSGPARLPLTNRRDGGKAL